MKTILLSYKAEKFQALNSHGTGFVLTLERTRFFGLSKKIITTKMIIPHHAHAKNYFDLWDSQINNKTLIK